MASRRPTCSPPLSPRELFPWLSAGVSLQLRRNKFFPGGGRAGEDVLGSSPSLSRSLTSAAAGDVVGTDAIFLIVSDKVHLRSILTIS